jgi:drug/metabolite transporter (DMT)-like permease
MVAVAATGWGTWPFFLRRIEHDGPLPAALEASAVMLGLMLASGALMTRDRVKKRARARDWGEIAALGLFDALNVVFFFCAYQRTSVAVAVLTHYLTPMLVAVGAPALGLESWQRRTFVAVGISLAGLLFLLAPWSAERHAADLTGALFGLASAVCYATNVLVAKRLVPVFSGSEMAFYHAAISVLILVLLVPEGAFRHVEPDAARWLVLGALLPGATCGLLFAWGLRRIHASRASNLTLLEPLVATVGASVALRQPLGAGSLAGGALILAGAALAATRPASS